MRESLHNPYISVADGASLSYGGSQILLPGKAERAVGCGVIAGLDLLLYLSRWHGDGRGIGLKLPVPAERPIPLERYNALAQALRRAYLPLIPGHGINGLMLALGLNACLHRAKLPYTAFWGVPYARLWDEMAEMLRQDIPVIFSIGPNFPLFWQHQKLRLYRQRPDGAYLPGPLTHAHYVTVTGMDDEWLRIASWGRQYFIRREEYLAYVKEHSARLVSNILLVKKRPLR